MLTDRWKKAFCGIVVVSFCIVLPASAQTADEIVGKVRQKYEALKQVCADFTQTFHWKLADETQIIKGQICAKDGIKFRIESQDQLIITDGKTIWTMNKANKQVMVDNSGNNSGDNPFLKSYLKKYTEEYKAELMGTEKTGEVDYYHLKLTAKNEDQFVRQVEFWVESKSFYLTKVQQLDINDNSTAYEVENIKADVVLKDNSFVFSAPEGYEVIDLR